MRPITALALALVLPAGSVIAFAACGSKSSNNLGGGDDGTDDASTSNSDGGGSSSGSIISSSGGGIFSSDGGVQTQATDCKGGHYSGSFTGNYTSYLTSFFGLGGFPLSVTGDVELDLQETVTMSGGEIAMTSYNIANGTITGFANNVFPYHCDLVGSLDCNSKKLVNGGLRNCWYCVGLFTSTDGGGCGVYGHFAGPLDADYDGGSFSFVNGTWNGSEEAALDDAGTLPEGGGVNDAGLYVGPGNYGGSGNWNATYVSPLPDN